MRSKQAAEVSEAFQEIYEGSGEEIEAVQSDLGKEFYGNDFKKYLDAKGIILFSTLGSEVKASIVERFHRTIQERIHRYFSLTGKKRYVEVLQDFVDSYNKTPHKSLGWVAPDDVSENNREEIYKALYGEKKTTQAFRRLPSYSFKIDEHVRISLLKKSMEKGFLQSWSSEVYKIAEIDKSNLEINLYHIKDLKDEVVKGRFYPWQLQPVDYRLDELVHLQVVKRTPKKVLVHYQGWDKKFDEWLTIKEFTKRVA